MENSGRKRRANNGGAKSNSSQGSAGSVNEFEHVPLTMPEASKQAGLLSVHSPLGQARPGSSSSSSRGARFNRLYSLLAILGLLLVALCFLVVAFRPRSTTVPIDEVRFITVNGTSFRDGERPYFIAGFNVDNIVEAAIPEVSSRKAAPGTPTGRQMVLDVLSSASSSGMNLLRTWAHTTDPSHPLQLRPGVYDENVFEALDYVIAEAGRVGVRVTLSLVDNWRYRGGVSEFVDWSSSVAKRVPEYPPLIIQGDMTPETMTPEREEYESKRSALFYTDPACRSAYKAHMAAVLHRRNKFTGIKYINDPNIFSFGLINEPRCLVKHVAGCQEALQGWIQEMAEHFRTLDTKHLLTVGEEGFWGSGDASEKYNPGAADGGTWASETGQDFILNHNVPGISYASLHTWPDNWGTHDAEFITAWLERHADDAANRLGMPLLLEEVGKKVEPAPGTPIQLMEERDPVYRTVYRAVERSIGLGHALQGSLLWELDFRIYEQSPSSPYGVKTKDSTFDIIRKHAQRVKAYSLSLSPRSVYITHGKEAGKEVEEECWIGAKAMLGLVRRCELRPDACAATPGAADAAAMVKSAAWDEESGELTIGGSGGVDGAVYRSKEECCKPGLGAFATGCTSWS